MRHNVRQLQTQMGEDIDALAKKMSLSRQQTIESLKENYDGYHFTWPGPDVFNPYSLLNCFADGKIDLTGSDQARLLIL